MLNRVMDFAESIRRGVIYIAISLNWEDDRGVVHVTKETLFGLSALSHRFPFVETALNRESAADDDDDDDDGEDKKDDKKDTKESGGSSVNYSATLVTTAFILTYRTLRW